MLSLPHIAASQDRIQSDADKVLNYRNISKQNFNRFVHGEAN